MPVSTLNIAVRRPLGRDITQAPVIPFKTIRTVLRNPPIKQASRERFAPYFEKNGVFSEITPRRARRQIFARLAIPLNTDNRFNRYLPPNLPAFFKILRKKFKTR